MSNISNYLIDKYYMEKSPNLWLFKATSSGSFHVCKLTSAYLAAAATSAAKSTTSFSRGGLTGNRTFLRQISNAGRGQEHFDVYAFYANDSVWFINFMCPSEERLNRLSEDFMSRVKVL